MDSNVNTRMDRCLRGGYPWSYSGFMDIPSTVGDRLDKAMRDAKLPKQKDLERRTIALGRKVPQATISRILKGSNRNGPETETIKALAAACGVSFVWLMNNEGPQYLNDAGPGYLQLADEPNPHPTAQQIGEWALLLIESPPELRQQLIAMVRGHLSGAKDFEKQGAVKDA